MIFKIAGEDWQECGLVRPFRKRFVPMDDRWARKACPPYSSRRAPFSAFFEASNNYDAGLKFDKTFRAD